MTFHVQHRINPETGKTEYRMSDRPDEVFDSLEGLMNYRGLNAAKLAATFTLGGPR